MNLDNWFPTTVGREEHPEWLDPVNREFDKIFNTSNKDVNTNFYHNGETTYGKYSLVDVPAFQPFVEFLKQRASTFLELQGFDSSRVPWRPYVFANSFKEGSCHPKHVHSQCTISGIYYLRTPPGSSSIIFYPNQPFRDFFDYMFMVKDQNNWHSMNRVEYKPYPGLLLLWPAWLYHEVPPNQSVEPRTSIVFNL